MDTRKKKQKDDDLAAVKNYVKEVKQLSKMSPVEIGEERFLNIEELGLCENCHKLPNGRMFQGTPPLAFGLKSYFVKMGDKYFSLIDDPDMTVDEILEKINTSLKLKS
jgi:hypothetical protein